MNRMLFVAVLLLTLIPALHAQSNCSSITYQQTTSSSDKSTVCSGFILNTATYHQTWNFTGYCYNTQSSSHYGSFAVQLAATGTCRQSPTTGVNSYCDPAYTVTKLTPTTTAGGTYNQLFFDALDGYFDSSLVCQTASGNTVSAQCPTQACSSSPPPPDCGCCSGPVGAKLLLGTPQQKDVKLGKAKTSCFYNCPCCPAACSPASPIMIDLTGAGFFLTDAAHGVLFDIKDAGTLQVAWTAPGAQNAFLALPGPDGLVHDGQHLFGNFTPQPPCPVGDTSCSPNGFRALAVYDDPKNGGNGDGIIDARDGIFSSLRLWIDANHDGISQPNELYTLPALGINSISLNYKADERTDQYGNIFRYRAQVGSTSGAGRMAYDVFLVIQTSNAVTAQSCPAVQLPRLLPEGEDGRLH